MALVVLLKGINVGGHRSFRPGVLAKQLQRLDVSNIGAAGTFIVRKPVSRAALHASISERLPFDAHVMIVSGRDILRLTSCDPFVGQRSRPDIIPFASVLAKRRKRGPTLPLNIPAAGRWCVKVLAADGRFIIGLHRREMKAISSLGQLEKIFGAAATTRSWSTFLTIARLLEAPA